MPWRIYDDPAAGEAFANIVIGVALERERDTLRNEGGETLAGRTVEMNLYGVFRESFTAVSFRDFVAENRANGPVGVLDRENRIDRLLGVERVLA